MQAWSIQTHMQIEARDDFVCSTPWIVVERWSPKLFAALAAVRLDPNGKGKLLHIRIYTPASLNKKIVSMLQDPWISYLGKHFAGKELFFSKLPNLWKSQFSENSLSKGLAKEPPKIGLASGLLCSSGRVPFLNKGFLFYCIICGEGAIPYFAQLSPKILSAYRNIFIKWSGCSHGVSLPLFWPCRSTYSNVRSCLHGQIVARSRSVSHNII